MTKTEELSSRVAQMGTELVTGQGTGAKGAKPMTHFDTHLKRMTMRPRFFGMQRRLAQGFTLVEVLIVVGIVGVLVGLAYPRYQDYRDRIAINQAIMDIKVMQLLITDFKNSSGALPASLADVGNGGKLDPWGHPYVYQDVTGPGGHGAARKDHQFNPINSEFDLYSTGKDGVTKKQLTQKDSRDDIVRGRDGAFVGLAPDFSS